MYFDVPSIAIVASVIAVFYAVGLIIYTLLQDAGSKKMKNISKAIQEGCSAYLHRQYLTILFFAILIFLVLGYTIPKGNFNNGLLISLSFFVGAVFSTIAGYVGISLSVRANLRTAQAAKKSVLKGFLIAFRGGSVTGMLVAGLSLLGISGFYFVFTKLLEIPPGDAPYLLIGFVFGASLVSLFARVGGGIYSKAADIGADFIEKEEKNIPQDDPRNPAIIADDVGDNIGDSVGMGSDLFGTYALTLTAAMMLAASAFTKKFGVNGIEYPLALGTVAIVASILGTLFMRIKKNKTNVTVAFYKGIISTIILSAIGFYFITDWMIGDIYIYFASVIGLLLTLLISLITDYYTSNKYNPVKKIAKSSESGGGINVISGIAVGLESTFLPTILIVVAIVTAYFFGETSVAQSGIYGIAIAAVTTVSTVGIITAANAYGPIADNAKSIANMANLKKETIKNTELLDTAGNSMNAITKGYAAISASLGAIILFQAYINEIVKNSNEDIIFSLADYQILIGIFIGGLLPLVFSSALMESVVKSAHIIVVETKRQFNQIKGIAKGNSLPEYGRCVDIATKSAIREMVFPSILAITAPILVGVFLGSEALAGLLIGAIVVGFLMSVSMCIGGGAWDNTKKHIEDGHFGGKNSTAHKSAIIGDTLGDAYKDTAGPSLNVLIKIINIISLIIAPLIAGLVIWR